MVTLLRDHLGLALPPGLTNGGPYRVRGEGSVIPCVRFRRPVADGDAPGIIRAALQVRLYRHEHRAGKNPLGKGSSEQGTAVERQEPIQGTDGTDGTDPDGLHAREKKAGTEDPSMGSNRAGTLSSRSTLVSTGVLPFHCRSLPFPAFPGEGWRPEIGDPVEVRQPDGSYLNGAMVQSVRQRAGREPLVILRLPDGTTDARGLGDLRPCGEVA
ncbi:hypothetical protein [Cyanobium sp. Copco_Reservoir_LC18]|uniref:hypothetical protein n=1 Tax=Cyanobium sp. Copco_Reservoir_LC18 TaxID=1328305 RepID=UPI00135B83C9|nr:hypothetical protein [Cyanobium sp. Copco_Reservoir_LC18]